MEATIEADGEKDLSGKAFERQVADAYRALGFAVVENTHVDGKQTDLLARREVDGAPPIKLAIECKDLKSAVGNGVVEKFVARIVGQRQSGAVSAGVLVSRAGFTASARAVAAPHDYVSVLSWDQLTSAVLDVRNQLRDLVEEYEASEIFGHYLPLSMERLAWDTQAVMPGRPKSAAAVLDNWLEQGTTATESPNLLVILADFGAGKSTLLQRVHYERAKALLAGDDARVPLFVPLRRFRDTQDVTALVRMAFRDAYFRDLPGDLLWQRINAGRLYLLLDGFDEMAERSDTQRRLDLFRMLMPLLLSPCPAILTSRPSHFVERGELNRLLATLTDAETAIGGVRAHGAAVPVVDDLRRGLVDRFRETRPRRVAARVARQSVDVHRLRSLSKRQIEDFVKTRSEELRQAGTSVRSVVRFIERTYDLGDLASRPMLLAFILESVVIGALDPDDAQGELGPSGLYETYTQAKLELDLAKGVSRVHGVSVEGRRLFAEELALELYRNAVLEASFAEVFPKLVASSAKLRAELDDSGMSDGELATDLATSSFITLGDDGRCRFIHKSFRGFFVARAIRNALPDQHALLHHAVEQEVLYFLGGFAPTESRVGQQLWNLYKKAKTQQARSNCAVAYLYTRPHHERIRLVGGVIGDAAFARLAFDQTHAHHVIWSGITVGTLSVTNSDWRESDLVDSHVSDMSLSGGHMELSVARTTVEALQVENIWASSWKIEDVAIEKMVARESTFRIAGTDGNVGAVAIDRSRLELSAERTTVESMTITDASVALGAATVTELETHRAVVRLDAANAAAGGELHSTLLVVDARRGTEKREAVGETLKVRMSEDSVLIMAGGAHLASVGTTGAGVFGGVESLGTASSGEAEAWGVVYRADEPKRIGKKAGGPAFAVGNLVVLTRQQYSDAQSGKGRLAVLARVDAFLARQGTFTEQDEAELQRLLEDLRRAWARMHKRAVQASEATS